MKTIIFLVSTVTGKKIGRSIFLVKGIFFLLLFSFLTSSCDVVKRKYMKGFYVAKKSSVSKTDASQNIKTEKQTAIAFSSPIIKQTENLTEQKKDSAFTEEKHEQRIAHRKKLSKILPVQLKQLATKKEVGVATASKTKSILRSYPHGGCHLTPFESFFLGVIIVLAAIFCLAIPPVLISFWPDKPTFLIIAGIWFTWAIGIAFILFTFYTFWTIFLCILLWNIGALIAGGFLFDFF
ncbi:MAG: hypothetical protein IAF38_13830 [Bacteroidia bacterium]|nr:hypothetical protein [Bacteroidia bacterium]